MHRLPSCPKCGNKVTTPSRVFSVIVEPNEGERGLTERKVGMYQCPKCETKFPTVVSRQHYLIVGEEQIKEIQSNLKSLKSDNEGLQKRIRDMERDYADIQKSLADAKKEGEVKQMEAKLSSLEEQVSYLRKEKVELEEKVSKFSR